MADELIWATIDARCKPSKAAGSDGLRPVLQYGWIRHEDDATVLYATDSYIAVRIPIGFSVPTGTAMPESLLDRQALIPEAILTPEALKALDDGFMFRIADGSLQMHGQSVLYQLPDEESVGKPPDLRKVLEPYQGEAEDLGQVAISHHLLKRAGDAIGARYQGSNSGVRLSFCGRLRPVRVEPLTETGAFAYLMPIRDVAGGE